MIINSSQSKFSIKHSIEFNLVSWDDDNNNETFCTYSKDNKSLCYFDYRKLNKPFKEESTSYDIIKWECNNNKRYILEENTNQLLIEFKGMISSYESKKEIKDFSFDSSNEYILIITDHLVELIINK